ncbi:MAG: hypothetical protein LWY06_09080 [Firmicutes bacterium]|nr:hypothetical protein [Bacillota bacterium]
MGLQERRRIKVLQDEVVPEVKTQILELCGKDIEWEVVWDSFKDMTALDYIEYQGIRRVGDVFRGICYDEMGKEAVRDGVQKIFIQNYESADDVKVVFEKGVLEVHGAWGVGTYPREDDIKTLLEKGL